MISEVKVEAPTLRLAMNVPNGLTLLRVILTLTSAFLLWQGSSQTRLAAGVLLTIAWSTDWLDGFLARRLGQATLGGAIFDLIADRLLMTGISIITVGLGFWLPTRDLMPWAPYPYLIPVWAADLGLLIGILTFSIKRKKIKLAFVSPPLVARLAFPVQVLTLVLAVLNAGPHWLLGGLMYLSIMATLGAAYSYIRKGFFIFTTR